MIKLILGSQSPRRRDILNFFSLPFEQITPDFDETQVVFHGDPVTFVCEVAKRKALCLQERFPKEPILTADTIVFREGKLYMKPDSLDEAFIMLSELAGKKHSVFTAVCVAKGSERWVEAQQTSVSFHELTASQIHNYHQRFNPLDKAGSYAIQGGGAIIVKRIEGCYYNIMGLPFDTTRRLLSKIGIELWDYLKSV